MHVSYFPFLRDQSSRILNLKSVKNVTFKTRKIILSMPVEVVGQWNASCKFYKIASTITMFVWR